MQARCTEKIIGVEAECTTIQTRLLTLETFSCAVPDKTFKLVWGTRMWPAPAGWLWHPGRIQAHMPRRPWT